MAWASLPHFGLSRRSKRSGRLASSAALLSTRLLGTRPLGRLVTPCSKPGSPTTSRTYADLPWPSASTRTSATTWRMRGGSRMADNSHLTRRRRLLRGTGYPSSTRIFFFGPSAPGCMPSPGSCSQVVPTARVSSGYSNASSASSLPRRAHSVLPSPVMVPL